MKNGICYFDAHSDTLSSCACLGSGLAENKMHIDLERASEFSGYAQFFSIFADGGGRDDASDLYEKIRSYALSQIAGNPERAALCTGAESIEETLGQGLCCALLSVEGAELLACSEGNLERARSGGVRAVNITWNHDNSLSGSCATGTNLGLSAKGRSFIKKAQSLGVIVDLSHISERAFWDTAEIARYPVIAGHSNSASVFPHARNLTDDQFRFLVRCGGVAGINLYAGFIARDAGIDDVVRHIEHFMSLDGEKAVALGGDLDGCDRLPRGIAGIQDIHKLYEALLRLGYREQIVKDIFYNNLMRVVSACVI